MLPFFPVVTMSLSERQILTFTHKTEPRAEETDTGVGSLKSIIPLGEKSGREGGIYVLLWSEATLKNPETVTMAL